MPTHCSGSRPDRGGHRGAPIAALRPIAGIAETSHQHRPGFRYAIDTPTGGRRLGREPEAGQRGTDDVKRVGRGAAMGGRIGERLNYLVELDDGPRPAMGDDERHRLGMRRARVHEMDVKAVNLGGELLKPVESCLSTAPVVVFSPIPAYLLDPLQRRSLAPVINQLGLRPTGHSQPGLQVVEHVILNGDTKWLDGNHRRRSVAFSVCSMGLCPKPRRGSAPVRIHK